MGCICSKASPTSDNAELHRDKKGSKRLSKRFITPSKREEVVVGADFGGGTDGLARLIPSPRENGVPTPISSDEEEKKETRKLVDTSANGGHQDTKVFSVPNGIVGEQVAAGWPPWLASVAGEAIRGWVPRKADSFEKLDKIGQGTYSNVYKARDLETGTIVALKKVRFVNMDPESVRFMAREIHILRRLDHPNIIKLEGLVASRMSCSLYLIFEYMEHDLAGLAATPGIKFTEPQVKCYMQQLLLGLEHCHSRGILHRDIKGSNLLIDNSGILRIADFGLATFFNPNKKQPLTSRVVTLWYRPPELLLGATEYGVAVDLWSTGCILAELLMGKPIMTGRTEVEQLHKIFKLCGSPSEDYWRKSKLPHATIFKPQQPYKRCVVETFKDFPSSALALVDVLLAVETSDRGTAASALKSEFFTTKPFPCDPASLPKYPPSKEFDAKLREEEARKQRAAAKGRRGESTISRGSGHSKAVPAPDANAELQASVQKRQGQSKPKSTSEKYYPEEDGRSGFPDDPLRGNAANGISHSGPLSHLKAFGSSQNGNKFKEDGIRAPFDFSRASHLSESNKQRSYAPHGGTDLLRSNTEKPENYQDRSSLHWPHQKCSPTYNSVDDAEPSGKQELTHYLLDRPTSSHVKGDKIKGKESAMGVASKKKRMHYSGPLIPPAGNIDEMLKEHERQIQEAVRKARLDKSKIKKNYGEKVHSESLLHRS